VLKRTQRISYLGNQIYSDGAMVMKEPLANPDLAGPSYNMIWKRIIIEQPFD